MIGRPLGQAFPDRDSDRGPSEVCLEVAGLQGDRFGPIDLHGAPGRDPRHRRSRGQRPGASSSALVAGVDSSTGDGPVQRQGRSTTRSPIGPLRAGVVLLERRPGARVALPGAQRAGEHHDPGAQALQPLRRARPPAASGRRILDLVRRLQIRTASIEQPVAVAVGRQPAEGLPHASVPAGRGARDPRRRADPGRRRRLPLRHLRGAASERRGRGWRSSSSRATRSSSPASATASS